MNSITIDRRNSVEFSFHASTNNTELKELIQSIWDDFSYDEQLDIDGTSNNKIIGLGFFKKDGTFRTGAFRRGVVKGITVEDYKFNPKVYNLITLYDMNAKGYRNVPIDRLKYIKALCQTIDCDVFKTLDKVEA